MYKVTFHAYSGLSGFPHEFETREDARDFAARRIASFRKRTKVTTLKAGLEWESLEPEDAAMVPDYAGTLVLEHITFECRECGSPCETGEDATLCCVDEDSSADDYHESIGNANWGIDSH